MVALDQQHHPKSVSVPGAVTMTGKEISNCVKLSKHLLIENMHLFIHSFRAFI